MSNESTDDEQINAKRLRAAKNNSHLNDLTHPAKRPMYIAPTTEAQSLDEGVRPDQDLQRENNAATNGQEDDKQQSVSDIDYNRDATGGFTTMREPTQDHSAHLPDDRTKTIKRLDSSTLKSARDAASTIPDVKPCPLTASENTSPPQTPVGKPESSRSV